MTETEYIRAMNRITDATFTTTCARCAAPIEVTDATADAVSKAHEERCFVVGDVAEWRLDGLTWERVTVVRAYPGDKFEIEHERTVERWQVHRSEMRPVAREEQAVGCPRPAAKLRDHLVKYKKTITGPAPNCTINGLPAHCPEPLLCGPTLYDGLTGAECMTRWSGNRTCVEHGEAPMFAMTPAQIAEAKRQYLIVAHHTWSRLLAAKVAASSERERLTVVNEQDCEDE